MQTKQLIWDLWEEIRVPGCRFDVEAVSSRPTMSRITMKVPPFVTMAHQAWMESLVTFNGPDMVPDNMALPTVDPVTNQRLVTMSFLSQKEVIYLPILQTS